MGDRRKSAGDRWNEFGAPGSFSSADYLAKSNPRLSKTRLKKELAEDPAYQAHRERPKRIKRRADVATFFSSRFEGDLADVGRIFNDREGDNKTHRYFLLLIDVFSKKIWGKGLANKSGPVVAEAVDDIFRNLEPPYSPPKVLATDGGAEFTGKEMLRVCARYGTRPRVAYGTSKASVAERAIRSAKKVLLTALKSGAIPDGLSWDGCVQRTLDSLNGRFNRSIGCSPDQVPRHWRRLMDEAWKRKLATPYESFRDYSKARGFDQFRLGDLVLVPKTRGNFKKETDNFFNLMPKVLVRRMKNQYPPLYLVKDPRTGKVSRQKYYVTQLKKIKLPAAVGDVSKIVDAKLEGGRVRYEVEGKGWV